MHCDSIRADANHSRRERGNVRCAAVGARLTDLVREHGIAMNTIDQVLRLFRMTLICV